MYHKVLLKDDDWDVDEKGADRVIVLPGNFHNILCGEDPSASILLGILGLTRDMIPRYRDCYRNSDNKLVVYSRCGGMEFELWQHIIHHPQFSSVYKDQVDRSYIYFVFDIPPGKEPDAMNCPMGQDPSYKRALAMADAERGNVSLEVQEKLREVIELMKGKH